jgi:hypothetical protein
MSRGNDITDPVEIQQAPSPIWLGRLASWGVVLAYALLVAAATVSGFKIPGLPFNFAVCLSAILGLGRVLKSEPNHGYALAARKIAYVHMGIMLTGEAIGFASSFWAFQNYLPPGIRWTGLIVFLAHVAVAIWGTFHLAALTARGHRARL